jgi:hypothetical protein
MANVKQPDRQAVIYVYLACPVRPLPGSSETKESNLARAREYYRRLSLAHPDKTFLAPWILNCEVFDETPEMIELGMKRNYAVIEMMAQFNVMAAAHKLGGSELWLCGPRVTDGMQAEADYAKERRLNVERVLNNALDAGLGEDFGLKSNIYPEES